MFLRRDETMSIQGARVRLRPLQIGDREQLPKWGRHASPLFDGYNYSDLSVPQRRYWYDTKRKARNRYFAVDTKERRLIGYLGAKNINFLTRSATLGIVFDPNFVSQGYGTEAMQLFLPYYFGEMRMKTLYLDVNAFNTRAIAMYESLGFEQVDTDYERFENQSLTEDDPELAAWPDAFLWEDDILYAKIYKMRMDAK